jgi:hypothetical protein
MPSPQQDLRGGPPGRAIGPPAGRNHLFVVLWVRPEGAPAALTRAGTALPQAKHAPEQEHGRAHGVSSTQELVGHTDDMGVSLHFKIELTHE